MSSFFTVPASQRKRKLEDLGAGLPAKRRNINVKETSKGKKSTRPIRDESISGSDSEEAGKGQKADEDALEVSSGSDDQDETAAERRLKLAEKYLQSIKGVVDEVGYDAEEIDRDLIAERLQEDSVCAG